MIQTLDATDIGSADAVLNAFLDLADCKYDALEYGFEVTPDGGSPRLVKSVNHSEKKFSVKVESLSRDTKYSVVAYVTLDGRTYRGEMKDFIISYKTPDLIDLGLSVKWASFNLGAGKPEEYGGYYQWAGTKDVTDRSIYLDWGNCPYHTGSDKETGWTKYIPSDKSSYWSGSGSPDDKTVLDPEDDVVHVKLGGSWRMPRDEEWSELRNECTSEWTTFNGVDGIMFTSRKNGNSVFFPAAGHRYEGILEYAGSDGSYWPSTLTTDYPCFSYYVYFCEYYVTRYHYGERYYGRSVRPVSE